MNESEMNTTPWRSVDEIEDNPVGLPESAAKALIPELNAHLSSMFVLFHQYQKHHWLVEGPQFRDIHHFLEDGYTQIHKQVDAVAERITAIGGVPVSAPDAQVEAAYIEHEPEGIFRIRDMLARDRMHERTIAVNLRKTIRLCTEHGDFATETLLKGMLLDIEDRAHHLDHFLGEDSLGLAFVEESATTV